MSEILTLTKVLKAPRALIYECWTTPEHMAHWFMPKPHYLTDISIDLRPGGKFESTMHVDGNAIPNRGCVLDAVKDTKFAWTDLMTEDFQPVASPGLGFTATIELSDHSDGTVYHVTARHRTPEEASKHDEMGFTHGWGIVADQLGAYAAALDATRNADRQMILTRHYRASPEQVWKAWTDPAILPRWFGPEGIDCVTKEIDLREGGVWRFDMIGHGQVWANRHRFTRHVPHARIEFLMDDDSDAAPPYEVVVTMTPEDGGTRLTQVMTFPSVEKKKEAEGYNAVELGQTTLAKLARELGEG